METASLCQALLDHIARELPDEHESLLGLAALLTFHPQEQRLFVLEAMALLMRHQVALPDALAREVSRQLAPQAPVSA